MFRHEIAVPRQSERRALRPADRAAPPVGSAALAGLPQARLRSTRDCAGPLSVAGYILVVE